MGAGPRAKTKSQNEVAPGFSLELLRFLLSFNLDRGGFATAAAGLFILDLDRVARDFAGVLDRGRGTALAAFTGHAEGDFVSLDFAILKFDGRRGGRSLATLTTATTGRRSHRAGHFVALDLDHEGRFAIRTAVAAGLGPAVGPTDIGGTGRDASHERQAGRQLKKSLNVSLHVVDVGLFL